jgi:hypothetical protein
MLSVKRLCPEGDVSLGEQNAGTGLKQHKIQIKVSYTRNMLHQRGVPFRGRFISGLLGSKISKGVFGSEVSTLERRSFGPSLYLRSARLSISFSSSLH